MDTMIIVTRLNGPAFAVNPDLVERAEATPDTVLTLVDGTKFVIAESLDVFINRVRDYRASVVARSFHPDLLADALETSATALETHRAKRAPTAERADDAGRDGVGTTGTVVSLNRREG
jgi:flagellar protein FlbD